MIDAVTLPNEFLVLLAAVFGLLIGSFLNVCVHRWPRDMSVVTPRSHCPECHAMIPWYRNIPVFSFLWLRGRCGFCGTRISFQYPLVELLTGLLFGVIVWQTGWSLESLRNCILCAMLLGLAFADLETRILPDQWTIGGIFIAFVFSSWVAPPDSSARFVMETLGLHPLRGSQGFFEAIAGAVFASGPLWLTGWLVGRILRRDALGFGDVKMMAMIGAFLGIRGALLTLIAASLIGSIGGLIYLRVTRKDSRSYELPLGTMLGFAGIFVLLAGQTMINWYTSFLER